MNKFLNWYQANIFPWLMDKNLRSDEIKKARKGILSYAQGDILEIGIGLGNNFCFYPNIVKKITAIDIYIRNIKNDRMEVNIKPCICKDMRFPDNSFDTVVTTFCLCSLSDIKNILEEVKRILKPEGRLILLEHGKAIKTYEEKLQKDSNFMFNIFSCECNMDRDYFKLVEEFGFKFEKRSRVRCGIHPILLAGYLYKGIAVVNK